jgi:hypothetical protein
MKRLLGAIALVFLLLALVASHQAADNDIELIGVIKNVSVNVRLIVINVTDQQGKDESVKSSPDIKSVSVAPPPPTTVNGNEATIQDLQAGQPVKVLEGESGKAMLIEVGTAMAENK